MEQFEGNLALRQKTPDASHLAARIIDETSRMSQKTGLWSIFKTVLTPAPMATFASVAILLYAGFTITSKDEMQMNAFEELQYVYEMELTAAIVDELEY